MKFVLATHNMGKVVEMQAILDQEGLPIELVTAKDMGIVMDVEETGTTFAENAHLKADAICKATGLPAIADDSGICVAGLNGGPGVYSARFGGEELNDEERNALLLEMLHGQGDRSAYYHASICCIFPDGKEITAEGQCHGAIAYAPNGTGGFGYDPLFLVPGRGKTMACLTPEEKNEISHRGKALRAFAARLKEEIKEWN